MGDKFGPTYRYLECRFLHLKVHKQLARFGASVRDCSANHFRIAVAAFLVLEINKCKAVSGAHANLFSGPYQHIEAIKAYF